MVIPQAAFGGGTVTRSYDGNQAVNLWTSDVNPVSFFREKVLEAQARQNVQLTENVEFYIVNLLCDMVSAGTSKQVDDCLALILKKALESPRGEQVLLYKRLGDTALYFSGFFQEYFNNKCFDVSYYVMMGESAYGQLSTLMRKKSTYESTMSKIYGEMSTNFAQAVDILTDVSEQTNHTSPSRTTLGLYDAWLSTASQKLERDLRKRGINPVKVSKKTLQ